MIEFRQITDFPRGTLYDILVDAYSYDKRNRQIWDKSWKETDDFFYDNPEIADKYGLVTCLDGEAAGFVTWDPRNRPDYVEIGHNGIREKHKRHGYGRLQLEEALRRIREYEGLKRIIVITNSNLIAPKNYESVGFILYDRKPNNTESAYTGDYLYYELVLKKYKIRNAVPADEKKIQELFLEMLLTIYCTENIEGYKDGDLDRFWSGSKDRVYVAEDREVVAFLSVEVHDEPEKYIYLDDFSVTRAYRNRGIGSELLRCAETYARENHIFSILLHVEKVNKSAIRLYERLGFTLYRDDGHRYLFLKEIK